MLPTGTRLGRYEVLTALGEGGMGEVYRAKDERLGRDVAIKILPSSFSADPDRLRRFEQEARATGALNHPNVIVVHDTGQHDGAPYVVYELLEGTTLRALLTGTPLSASRTIRLGTDIAAGLAAAHDRGIVHRDLKPENLFVTREGRVKILDFGIASVAERTGLAADTVTKQTTDPGMIVGTVGYMSPEQARGTRVDHRSDIFSLGVVLYEMLSGQRPFGRASAIETLNAIISEDPPDIPPGPGDSPPALERIVRHCLEKPPDLRFQSARDVAFALEGVSTRSGTHAVGPGTRSDRPSLRTRIPWIVATVANTRGDRSRRNACPATDCPRAAHALRSSRARRWHVSRNPRRLVGDLAGWVDVGHGGDDQDWPATLLACSRFCRIPARRRQ